MGNWTVSSQHTTRTTMTNQSMKLLKEAQRHSRSLASKHDHLNTTNYVWDRSFASKTVIHPRSTSPHFSSKSSLFATTSRNEKESSLATINDRLCQTRSLKSSIKFKEQQGSRSSRLFPVDKSHRSRSSSSSGPRQDPNNLICHDLLLS
jgi:hypothetical protein